MKRKSSLPVNLDERVIFTLIVSGFISLGFMFLSFRYNNYKPCYPGEILFTAGNHYSGGMIQFSTEATIEARKVLWDFGDRPAQAEYGNKVYHTYATPGLKRIKLTINGNCTTDTSVSILALPQDIIFSQPLLPQPKFSGPPRAAIGELVSFKDSTPNAMQWQWQFGETGKVDADIQNPKYSFMKAGIKIVTLVVNEKIRGNIKILVTSKTKRRRHHRKPDNGPDTPPVRVQLNEEKNH